MKILLEHSSLEVKRRFHHAFSHLKFLVFRKNLASIASHVKIINFSTFLLKKEAEIFIWKWKDYSLRNFQVIKIGHLIIFIRLIIYNP